jgi:hypothetical protein
MQKVTRLNKEVDRLLKVCVFAVASALCPDNKVLFAVRLLLETAIGRDGVAAGGFLHGHLDGHAGRPVRHALRGRTLRTGDQRARQIPLHASSR